MTIFLVISFYQHAWVDIQSNEATVQTHFIIITIIGLRKIYKLWHFIFLFVCAYIRIFIQEKNSEYFQYCRVFKETILLW